ncbi:MAG: SAM-dependent methyltransferase [Patescibacteria group bacterium]
MSAFLIVFLLVLAGTLAAIGLVIASFGVTALWGAPFVGTPATIVRRMLVLAEAKAGETVMDLGSGTGAILILAAKEFQMKAIGYEINPFLRVITRLKAWHAGVADRVEVRGGNIVGITLPEAEVVTLFLLEPLVERLRPKLIAELPETTRIIARDFHLKHWPHYAEDGWLRAYRKQDVL